MGAFAFESQVDEAVCALEVDGKEKSVYSRRGIGKVPVIGVSQR